MVKPPDATTILRPKTWRGIFAFASSAGKLNRNIRLQKQLGGYMAHELGIAEIRSFLDTAKTSDSLKHKL
jgi:hypothetical protein